MDLPLKHRVTRVKGTPAFKSVTHTQYISTLTYTLTIDMLATVSCPDRAGL